MSFSPLFSPCSREWFLINDFRSEAPSHSGRHLKEKKEGGKSCLFFSFFLKMRLEYKNRRMKTFRLMGGSFRPIYDGWLGGKLTTLIYWKSTRPFTLHASGVRSRQLLSPHSWHYPFFFLWYLFLAFPIVLYSFEIFLPSWRLPSRRRLCNASWTVEMASKHPYILQLISTTQNGCWSL